MNIRKKTIVLFVVVVALLGVGIGVAVYLATKCEHVWEEATCVVPKTCTLCGRHEGDLGEHEWEEATCTIPKTCSVCDATEGELAAHQWEEATCTVLKTCSVCGETEGELAPHQWEEATCAHPRQCSVCKKAEGEALPHQWEEGTCTTPETCMVCKETRGEAPGHSPIPATCIEVETCAVCGKKLGNRNDINNHNLDVDGVCLWCENNFGLKFTENNYKNYFLIYALPASYQDGTAVSAGWDETEISLLVETKKIPDKDISYATLIADVDITYQTRWPIKEVTYHTRVDMGKFIPGKKYYQNITVNPEDYFGASYSRSQFDIQVQFSGYAILKDPDTGDMFSLIH